VLVAFGAVAVTGSAERKQLSGSITPPSAGCCVGGVSSAHGVLGAPMVSFHGCSSSAVKLSLK